jgi:hypothetical protein
MLKVIKMHIETFITSKESTFVPLQVINKNMNKSENNYRKVTRVELEAIGFVFPTDKYKEHITFARKYYPKEATSIVIVINSEYNDNTYDNRFSYLLAYNKNGDELPPLKETAKECRQKWFNLSIPGMINGYESNEHIENIVIPLSDSIPDLYIKE